MKYKLKEIFDLQMGKTPARNNDKYWNSKDYKWISIADLTSTDKYINNTKEYISQSAVTESGIKIIPANTVVMSFKLSIGKTAILSEDMYSNEAIMAFHDKHVVELLPEYIYYLIKAKNWNCGSNRAVMGQTLNKATLSEIEVNVHTIDEQRKIVKLMSSIEKVIDNRKEQLQKLGDITRARFVEMFVSKNYPREELDNLSYGKGEYGAQSASVEYNSSRPRYVRITDIKEDGSLNDDVVCSANVEDDELYKLEYGDFCFARMGATVGKTYAYRGGNQIFAGYLIRYKLNLNRIIPEYLYEFTRLHEYRNWVSLNQSGAAQPGINAKKYGSLMIPVAPLEEQRVFATFVEQVNKSKFEVQKALDKAQLLFDSLMQKYFG